MSTSVAAERARHDIRTAKIIPYPDGRNALTAYLGMAMFLATWAVMFGSLFVSYGLMRSRAPVWPPPGQPRLPLAVPGLNVLVAGASSLALVGAVRALRAAHSRRAAQLVTVALALAVVFLGLQFAVWASLRRAGLQPGSGPYTSVVYALTAFHALHLAVGLLALGFLAVGAWRGRYGRARHLPVRMWSMYWNFVAAVWLAIYATVYVL